jgi:hypothetical protein
VIEHDQTVVAILAGPATADLHGRLSSRLRSIADRRETPGLRAEAEAAFATKWWHIRILALQCFGRWGGKANKAWLKARAERHLTSRRELLAQPRDKAAHWLAHETLAARQALTPLVEAGDADWLLDVWFGERSHARHGGGSLWSSFEYWWGAYSLIGAISRLPHPVVRERIDAEAASPDPALREAALVLAWNLRSFPDHMTVLARMAHDVEPRVAALAKDLLRVHAATSARDGVTPSATPSTAPRPRNKAGRAAGSRLSAYRRSGAGT